MKIRNGFVSNSSSSSFIIGGNMTTCVDVAINMFTQLKSEDYITNDLYEFVISNLNEVTDKNIGIFYEMADDLIISKVGDDIIVNATSHITWDIDFMKKMTEEYEYYDYQIQSKFYFPAQKNKKSYNIYNSGRFPGIANKYKNEWIYKCDNKNCNNKSIYVTAENKIFCPNCFYDPDGKEVKFRVEKLKRILDIK